MKEACVLESTEGVRRAIVEYRVLFSFHSVPNRENIYPAERSKTREIGVSWKRVPGALCFGA